MIAEENLKPNIAFYHEANYHERVGKGKRFIPLLNGPYVLGQMLPTY